MPATGDMEKLYEFADGQAKAVTYLRPAGRQYCTLSTGTRDGEPELTPLAVRLDKLENGTMTTVWTLPATVINGRSPKVTVRTGELRWVTQLKNSLRGQH